MKRCTAFGALVYICYDLNFSNLTKNLALEVVDRGLVRSGELLGQAVYW